MLSRSPEAKVVASRGDTISGLPLIGQSSRSPPASRTASRMPSLRSTGIVLISMCTVPGRNVVTVPAGPVTTCSTAFASGRIDTMTSASAAASATEAATVPPALASSLPGDRR